MNRMDRIGELEAELVGLNAKIKILKENEESIQPKNILSVPFQVYVCNWCSKEFDSRPSVFEHLLQCKPKNMGIVKPTEKVFTCNLCGIQLNRNDMKDHAMKCGLLKNIRELEEKITSTEDNEDTHEQIEQWKNELDIKTRSLRNIS